ncbi:MAG: serine/threonine protein kinase [Myxococcota bacterium]
MKEAMDAFGGRQFEFLTCLGRGGFGEVYRAMMVNSGGLSTEVAIKLLRSDIGLGDEAIARLRDEGQLLALLRHPAILRVIDLTEIDGRVGMITEYIEGEDLHIAIRHPTDPIPLRPLLRVIGQVAEALHAAYGAEVQGNPLHLVHRDIKPSNVRIGEHGEVKLLDFGVAFSSDADRNAMTLTNTALGSLAYMAPERFKRTRPGPAADVYALGCCMYEGLVRNRLFGDPTAVEMFARAAVAEDHDVFVGSRFAALPADLPAQIGALLGDMLAYDETERPSAAIVAERCESMADGLSGATLQRWMRQHERVPQKPLRGSLEGQVLSDRLDDPNRFARATPGTPKDAYPTFLFGDNVLPESDAAHGVPPSPRRRRSSLPDAAAVSVTPHTATAPPAASAAPGGSEVPLVLLAITTFVVASVVMIAALLWLDPRGAPSPVEGRSAPLQLGVEFEVEEPPMGAVRIQGTVEDVEFRSGVDVYGPGPLPAGTYEVYADFGLSMRYVTNLTVRPDSVHTLVCDAGTCSRR